MRWRLPKNSAARIRKCTSCSGLFDNQPGHGLVDSFRLQTFVDPLTVGSRSVLAYLPLALNAQDRDFDSDNGADLALDVRLRRIAHVPGFIATTLLRGS